MDFASRPWSILFADILYPLFYRVWLRYIIHVCMTIFLILFRMWKGLLQCCENLRTYTHPEKNKWTEGLELINKHVEQMLLNIDKNFIK